MGALRDATGGYTGGLLVLAAVLVLEAVLVLSLRLPSQTARPALGLRGSPAPLPPT
jgi:hypothetical protein